MGRITESINKAAGSDMDIIILSDMNLDKNKYENQNYRSKNIKNKLN